MQDFKYGFRRIDDFLRAIYDCENLKPKFHKFLSLYLHFHNSIHKSVVDLEDNVEIYSLYFHSTDEDEFEYMARMNRELVELKMFYTNTHDTATLKDIAINFKSEYDMLFHLCSADEKEIKKIKL